MDITFIKTDQITPNTYNPNVIPEDILAKLGAEIRQKGLTQPIIVRSRGNGYVIVDGYHRWQICRDLGWQEVPCIIQDYDDNEAKIKTLQLNYMRGSAVPIKLASLIHELSKEIKLEDLAKRSDVSQKIIGIRITPHYFRHRFLTECGKQKVPYIDVMHIAGIKDIKVVTAYYNHTTPVGRTKSLP